MLIRQFVVEGLGHLSTLIADEAAGVAAVVDPRRDVDGYLDAARAADVRITHVVETHLHNDYVSGGRELSDLTGAQHVIGRGAQLAYEHRPIGDRESFDVGGVRFTALDTPGHTPEHVSYAVADRSRTDEPAILLTGGSLLVGAVGRTDLLGAEHAMAYGRDQFDSLRNVILAHHDHTIVYPTHGAGSLCSTGIAATPLSTVGYERRHNPMLQPRDFETFARVLLDGQPAFPRYFARMRPTNQAGPALLGARIPDPRPMTAPAVRAAVADGARLIDLRSPAAHAAAHVPGSLSIPVGPSFGTWLGWVVDPEPPLVLILEHPDDWDEAIRQALRVGYTNILGHIRGGLPAWTSAGGDVASGGRLTVDQLAAGLARGGSEAPLVVDVRQAREYDDGHVPGAVHAGAGDLPGRLAELPRDRPLATICASGYRASVAASLLRQAGFANVSWVGDGVPAWEARGHEVERGSAAADPADGPLSLAGHEH